MWGFEQKPPHIEVFTTSLQSREKKAEGGGNSPLPLPPSLDEYCVLACGLNFQKQTHNVFPTGEIKSARQTDREGYREMVHLHLSAAIYHQNVGSDAHLTPDVSQPERTGEKQRDVKRGTIILQYCDNG